ncbi:MAG: SBBP repeat-containing protein [Bacteroidia bacterium]
MTKQTTFFNVKAAISTLLLALLPGISVFSQTGWQWGQSGASTGAEYATSIATDPLGNSYVTGTFSTLTYTVGAVTLNNTQTTGNDVFILKYDASGTLLWAKSYGGAGGNTQDYSPAITLDGAGNFYLSGYTDCASIAFGTTTLTSFGSPGAYNTYFLVKLDASGNPLWARGSNGQAFAVAANSSGVCLTGWFLNPGMSVGTTTFTGSGFFIARYDSNGNPLWLNKATSSAGGGVPMGTSITMDASNNCIVGGNYSKTLTIGSTTLANFGSTGTDIFIAKYDPSGSVIWATNFGSGGNDNLRDLATDAAGNVFMTGDFTGTVSVGSTVYTAYAGVTNEILVKFDMNGNSIWAQRPTFTSVSANIIGNSVVTDNAGNVYVAGSFATKNITAGPFTVLNTVTTGSRDMFIIKCNNAGTVLGLYTLGGAYDEEIASASVDASGNIFVSGYYTTSTLTVGTSTLSHSGNSNVDIVVARYNPAVSTSVGGPGLAATTDVKLYPNPAKGILNIQLPGSSDTSPAQAELFNNLGQEVKSVVLNSPASAIGLEGLEPGVYVVKITDGAKTIAPRKIIIQ